MTLPIDGPNAEQIRYWAEAAGPKWVRFQALLDAQIRGIGERAMERGGIAPGERVLDVGCGCGDTTMELPRRVGAAGRVLGVDISAPMLARAAERIAAAGLPHARVLEADAQTHVFEAGAFDVLFSRFGVMFFSDPTAAFANLRAALRPGGRLAFACWQSLQQNPWLLVPLSAVAQHIALPPPPAPDAPGPFALADADRVRVILTGAGFAQIAIEPHEHPLFVAGGAGLDGAVELLLEGVGPTSAALREADPALRPVVTAAVRAALAPYAEAGGVRMPSAAWIVTAENPAA
jgi:SAM-dependent methyltransferase